MIAKWGFIAVAVEVSHQKWDSAGAPNKRNNIRELRTILALIKCTHRDGFVGNINYIASFALIVDCDHTTDNWLVIVVI